MLLVLYIVFQVVLLVALCGKKKAKSVAGPQSVASKTSGVVQQTKNLPVTPAPKKPKETDTDKKNPEAKNLTDPKNSSKETVGVKEKPVDKTQQTAPKPLSMKSNRTKTLPVQQMTDDDPGGYENVQDMNADELAKIAAEAK